MRWSSNSMSMSEPRERGQTEVPLARASCGGGRRFGMEGKDDRTLLPAGRAGTRAGNRSAWISGYAFFSQGRERRPVGSGCGTGFRAQGGVEAGCSAAASPSREATRAA